MSRHTESSAIVFGGTGRALLLIAAAGLAAACSLSAGNMVVGSGTIAVESRDVTAVDTVVVRGSAKVDVTIGSPPSLEVEADDNILPLVTTSVDGGVLTVATEGSYRTENRVRVRLVTPELTEAIIEGSGDVDARGIDSPDFRAEVRGSGDVTASGSARAVSASVKGSGDIDLSDVDAENAEATVFGSGDIEIRASRSVDARIAGSGDVRYRGDPADVTVDVDGSGEVKRLD